MFLALRKREGKGRPGAGGGTFASETEGTAVDGKALRFLGFVLKARWERGPRLFHGNPMERLVKNSAD